ncbi:MAG: class I SAM-dependent methyltransferase [Proteobacteria bacterium]|nr:class I SAM-dependent methyltransferase [Pseudomonadota bacterium]
MRDKCPVTLYTPPTLVVSLAKLCKEPMAIDPHSPSTFSTTNLSTPTLAASRFSPHGSIVPATLETQVNNATSCRPTLLERLALRFINRFLSSLKRGELTIVLPDGETRTYGSAANGRRATMVLQNYRLFWRVLKDGAIGLGESFVDGDWNCDHLPTVISILLENLDLNTERALNLLRPVRFLHRLWHQRRHNSPQNARKNIHAHYDLGNEFFSRLLDPTMTYSSAVFRSAEESLEQAQLNKLRLMIDKAMIGPEDHVLEIGSGWGSFALTAARERGCRVTTITLSEEQKKVVETRIAEAGLADKITVQLCDYRHIQGSFDKIVSIEMMEAIGQEYLSTFFACCERLLKPTGIAVVQVITMVDHWYEEYCKRCDWIQKHIFPGSHLPSLTALSEAITKGSQFVIEHLENLAPHYAKTLALWRARLNEITPEIAPLGYDVRFQRTFDYYLASCEAEFGTRWLNLLQLTLTRPNNTALLQADSQTPALA